MVPNDKPVKAEEGIQPEEADNTDFDYNASAWEKIKRKRAREEKQKKD